MCEAQPAVCPNERRRSHRSGSRWWAAGCRPRRRCRAPRRRARRPPVRGRWPPGWPQQHHRRETRNGPLAVDTGFIVFNDRNYPNFERLLFELGVPSQPARMSFSVSDGRGDFEWSTRGLLTRPAHLLDRRFRRMLLDLVRFNRDARVLIGALRTAPRSGASSRRELLRLLHRAAPGAAGVGGLVRRPRAALAIPGGLPGRVLREPRGPPAGGASPLAHHPGRRAAIRRGADRTFPQPCPPPVPGAPHRPRRRVRRAWRSTESSTPSTRS